MPLATVVDRRISLEMNLNAALAKSLLMAASIGMVVPVLAETTVVKTAPGTTTPPQKPGPAKSAPTKPVASKPEASKSAAGKAAKGQPAPANQEPAEVVLPGVVQPRASGGFLTVEIESGKFKISFFDKDKKPVSADVARGLARWDSNRNIQQERTVLNLGEDGKALRGVEFVSPPYTFKLFLTLLDDDGNAVESYVVSMSP